MQGYHISSTSNPVIKDTLALEKRKVRNLRGLLTLEGFDEFRVALASGACIERLYICPDYLQPQEVNFLNAQPEIVPTYIAPNVMKRLAYRQHPDAWFAVLRWKPLSLMQLQPSAYKHRLFIIAEDVEKPGNIGAILRSADAAGMTALIISEGRTDLRNPNVLRASKGTLFSVPCAEARNRETLDWLRAQSIPIALAEPPANPPANSGAKFLASPGATPPAKPLANPLEKSSLWEIDLPSPLAVVLGAEKEGISQFWRNEAHIRIAIPMAGTINSLNVAQAATLIMYEVLRRAGGHTP